MIWVTAEDVVAIHSRIIQVSGGIDGLRDRAGLEAAIAEYSARDCAPQPLKLSIHSGGIEHPCRCR